MVSPTDPTLSRQQKAQQAATQAERDAAQRIQAAEKRVRDAQVQAETKIDEIRDEYVKRSELEHARRAESLENIQEKTYQELGKLKHQQSRDLARIRDQGEKDTRTLQDYYRDSLYTEKTKAEKELKNLQRSAQQQKEYLTRREQFESDALKQDHTRRLEGLQAAQSQEFEKINAEAQARYEKLTAESLAAREQTESRFQDRYAQALDSQREALSRVNSIAAQKVREIREDTELKLDAYSSRQRDPFYKLVNLEGELREDNDAFVLSARIPEHERANVSVSIQGGKTLVVSGHRRAQEAIEEDSGRKRSTSSYQSFSESFPLTHPVDAKGMIRDFDGDYLLVYLPKKPFYEPAPFHKAPKPERVRAERPQFPKNLNVAERPAPKASDEDEAPKPSPARPGTKPLV